MASKIKCGGNRTRTYEPEGGELQSPAIAAMRYPHLLQIQSLTGIETQKYRFFEKMQEVANKNIGQMVLLFC
jgi:hypothetical protein